MYVGSAPLTQKDNHVKGNLLLRGFQYPQRMMSLNSQPIKTSSLTRPLRTPHKHTHQPFREIPFAS